MTFVCLQDGATEEDIRLLPRYKFRRYNNIEKGYGEVSEPFGGIMTECGTETPMEHVLSAEDVVSLRIKRWKLYVAIAV